MTIINTKKGSKVQFNGEAMTVVANQSLEKLILRAPGGDMLLASLEDIAAETKRQKKPAVATDSIRLAKVPAYRAAFADLLDSGRTTRCKVEVAAKTIGISTATAYRALERFRLTQDISDLPPPTKPGGRGKSRLNPKLEALIEEKIDTILLTSRNFSIKKFIKDTKLAAEKLGFTVSDDTLRMRISQIPKHQWVRARKGGMEARRLLDPLQGSTSGADEPLQLVQMDHWKVDMEILSDDRKHAIGRAWLTLAIDVFSRCVWGLHVGLDAPGSTPAGFAMINGMALKGPVLRALGLDAEMPIHGKPVNLHLDNAGEFRGKTMDAACRHFGINIKFRAVGQPQYGGHIERLNKMLAVEFKDLPGATGSNPKERKDLKPEVTAAFTLEDLTKHVWMIINEYHNKPHSGIGGKTPLQAWKNHFFGPEGQKCPTPSPMIDDLAMRIMWYPVQTATIQRYGIKVDYLEYYDPGMQSLVRNRRRGEPVTIRRNPLDVREIFLLHPITRQWTSVECRHLLFPLASIIQFREAAREARRQKLKPTAAVVAEIIIRRQEHIETAQKQTKTARREAARTAQHARQRASTPAAPAARVSNVVAMVPKGAAADHTGNSEQVAKSGAMPHNGASRVDFRRFLSAASTKSIDEMLDE